MNRMLVALRWTYCTFIAWSSLQTLLQAVPAHDTRVIWLAGAELVAIAGLLVRRTEIAACTALVLVFAVAAVLTSLEGELPLRFVFFANTAIYIVITSRSNATAALVRRASAPNASVASTKTA